MLSEYMRGILYGDGTFIMKDGYELFMFSTTHKELVDKVKVYMNNNNYRYNHYKREFEEGHEKQNYETLEMIESYDKEFHEILQNKGFQSVNVEDRIQMNSDFLRGYLETKGTFFKSYSRNSEFWRFAISGSESDINYLKEQIERKLQIKLSQVRQRDERKDKGIVSKSFRVYTQARSNINKLVDYMYSEIDITAHLKHGFDGFIHFHKVTPFNRKVRVFKHYKSAVGYMARELGLELKGIRGVSALRYQKPVFLWNNDEITLCFNNYEKTYFWICEEYENKTGFDAPLVESVKNG